MHPKQLHRLPLTLISSSASLLCTLRLACPLPTLALQLPRELALTPRVSFLLGVGLQSDIMLAHKLT